MPTSIIGKVLDVLMIILCASYSVWFFGATLNIWHQPPQHVINYALAMGCLAAANAALGKLSK